MPNTLHILIQVTLLTSITNYTVTHTVTQSLVLCIYLSGSSLASAQFQIFLCELIQVFLATVKNDHNSYTSPHTHTHSPGNGRIVPYHVIVRPSSFDGVSLPQLYIGVTTPPLVTSPSPNPYHVIVRPSSYDGVSLPQLYIGVTTPPWLQAPPPGDKPLPWLHAPSLVTNPTPW